MKISFQVSFAMRLKRSRVLISLVLPLAWVLSASAGWTNVFEVKGISVDVTAENAAQARSEALLRGQQKAFRRLLERLILEKDVKRLPEQSTLEISEFVSDFAVSAEKASTVRYLAKLNVRFKAEPVRRLLKEYGIQFAETRSKPLLVLPISQDAQKLLLWEEANQWRKIWNFKRYRNGLVRIALPLADESDISAIDVDNAIGGNVKLLSALAARYGAGDTLVSHFRFGNSPITGRRRLEISNVRYSFLQEPVTDIITLAFKSGESKKAAMTRGVKAVIKKLEEEWKSENLLGHNSQEIGRFIVPISSLKDWLDLKRRINEVSIVRRIELLLVSLDEVQINLHYRGAQEQLRIALRQADLTMIQEGSEWVIYSVDLVLPEKS